MSSRVTEMEEMVLKPVTSEIVKLVREKRYSDLVVLFKQIGNKNGKLQYQVFELADIATAQARVNCRAEDIDIIISNFVDRVDKFGRGAFPLRDWEIEKVARYFVGWNC